jgi:hypothetical protein
MSAVTDSSNDAHLAHLAIDTAMHMSHKPTVSCRACTVFLPCTRSLSATERAHVMHAARHFERITIVCSCSWSCSCSFTQITIYLCVLFCCS